jgi:hypothetical protein
MLYTIEWADDTQTMVRQRYQGHINRRIFEAMVHDSVCLLGTVTHSVDIMIEWHGDQTLINDLSVISGAIFAEKHVPANQRFVFVVNAPRVYRVFVNTLKLAAPRAVGSLYFVDTPDGAYRLRDYLLEAGVSPV